MLTGQFVNVKMNTFGVLKCRNVFLLVNNLSVVFAYTISGNLSLVHYSHYLYNAGSSCFEKVSSGIRSAGLFLRGSVVQQFGSIDLVIFFRWRTLQIMVDRDIVSSLLKPGSPP